ncbi:HHR181Wp [Eremothecium sinecaudum]|uniref:Cytochrome c oxidase assembly protein COX20, mitochondrial n=1 Tax=Eremothecium sinecaudum TaxID=45286 RepID=A0A120K2Y4_9SACH|nr:HHR181Wp [Eremothecium sinecaudum]AMD22950.1 HHR181Wp [Eremothecium sinecaudum]
MVWFFSRSSKDEHENSNTSSSASEVFASSMENQEQPTNYVRGQKLLLEDTKPRFDTSTSMGKYAKQQERATLRDAWDSLTWEDFTVDKLTSIPCFRQAGLTGFCSMFVIGSVMFLYHKNPSKASNWAFGGLMLGSIVGWEQCRVKRLRSFQTAQMAKRVVAAKERPMLDKHTNDHSVKSIMSRDADNGASSGGKPWYKFW